MKLLTHNAGKGCASVIALPSDHFPSTTARISRKIIPLYNHLRNNRLTDLIDSATARYIEGYIGVCGLPPNGIDFRYVNLNDSCYFPAVCPHCGSVI